MSRLTVVFSVVSVSCLMLVASGCNESGAGISAETLKLQQSRLVLQEEPEDGKQTVEDVRYALLGEEPPVHDHSHDHGDEDHEGHDHDAEHAGHDHDGEEHATDEHAGHDHDEHAGHDHDEHAGHGHDEHDGHDHGDHAGHDHGSGPMEVVVVGRIGGLANPWESTQPDYPFAKNKAMFFLADPGAVTAREESGHVHAPGEECAFCAAHAAETSDMLAMVRFLGDRGKVLPIQIQQIVDLEPLDTVVVKGTARIIEGGMMVIDADGIYVRN